MIYKCKYAVKFRMIQIAFIVFSAVLKCKTKYGKMKKTGGIDAEAEGGGG